MPDILELQSNTLEVSITSGNKAGLDKTSPFTFKQWLTYNNKIFDTAEIFLNRYQTYLNSWYSVQNNKELTNNTSIKDLYVTLLKEIVLNYITPDEKRFLTNIDFNNNRELVTVIPFFAKKIKEICLYYSTLRDDVKTAPVKNNLRGSNYGIQKGIYNEISKALEAADITDIIKTLNVSLSDIRNNLNIGVEELYDTSDYYFDISPNVPLTAYNPSGDRKTYFELNVYDSDPYVSLDFSRSIIQAITSYPFFLEELGTNNFTITSPVSSAEQFYYLKDSDFVNTVNTSTRENLNLNTKKLGIEKYIGTDFYYVSTGSTIYDYVSGIVYKAKNSYANYVNKRYPTVAVLEDTSNQKTLKEVGGFFKPDKLGLSVFTSFNFTPYFNYNTLAPNSVYIFPDPAKYGNVSNTTLEEFNSPLKFVEYNYFNKIDISNQYRFGDVYTDSKLQTFRAYQSREQSLEYINYGIHRQSDPQDFFTSYLKNVWANEDVYPLIPADKFPINNRSKTLIPTNKSLVQFKSDVYGNSYGLFKFVQPLAILPSVVGQKESEGLKLCSIINGGVLNPFIYNFELKTTTNMPPGTGYYISYSYTDYPIKRYTDQSPLSTFYYNDGVPTFGLPEGEFTNIVSYSFLPEIFCSETVDIFYSCNYKDGLTFVSQTSAELTDYPSDNPSFNPASYTVYYSELIDGAANPTAPGYRPVYGYPPDFTYQTPLSAVTNIDGFLFLVNNEPPCGSPVSFNEPLYTERSNFINLRIPGRTTLYADNQYSILEKQDIYHTNFVNYGDFYYRNSNSTIIEPVSSALSAIFVKYTDTIRDEINNKLINFDVYYDVLYLETESYVIFEKILFDYTDNTLKNSSNNINLLEKYINSDALENISTIFFNEKEKKLYFSKNTVLNLLSGSIYKTIVPEMYSVSLLDCRIHKEYPNTQLNVQGSSEIFNFKDFSLITDNTNSISYEGSYPDPIFTLDNTSSKLNININYTEKSLLSYDADSETFFVTYLGKDTSDFSYMFKHGFKYFNGILENTSTNMYMPSANMLHIAFGLSGSNIVFNNLPAYFKTQTVLNSPGNLNINNGTFVFGID